MKLNTKYFYKKYKEKGGILDYSIFFRIMDAYFQKATDIIVSEGIALNMRSNLGFLSIVSRERKVVLKDNGQLIGAINWDNSNKLKAQILKEGKVPLENYKDINGKIIGNNGGVPWLCYHTEPIYYQWSYTPNIYLKNCKKIKFEPSWTNKRKIGKLIDKDNEVLHL